MKRSRRIGLLAASTVSLLALAGCKDEAPVSVDEHQASIHSSIEACVLDAERTGASETASDGEAMSPMQKLKMACLDNWNQAQADHEKTAPRYESLSQCEAEYGTGNCGAPGGASGSTASAGGGGGSFFMPMMLGYMLGNMSSSSSGASHPIYADRSGGYRSNDASTTSRLRSSTSTITTPAGRSSAAYTRVTGGKISAPKATMQKSTATRSGGFGASRSSTSSRSSFGG